MIWTWALCGISHEGTNKAFTFLYKKRFSNQKKNSYIKRKNAFTWNMLHVSHKLHKSTHLWMNHMQHINLKRFLWLKKIKKTTTTTITTKKGLWPVARGGELNYLSPPPPKSFKGKKKLYISYPYKCIV